MITDFFRLWMARVQDSGAAIADPGTIRDYHCQLSQSASDRTTESDRCEEREPSAPTLFYFVKQVNESGSIANKQIQLGPYNGIQTGFWWLQWWWLFVARIHWIHGATGGWTIWALSGDQRIQLVLKAWRFNWCVVSPRANGRYWLSDSPNWVWQVCDSLSELIRTHGGSRGEYTVS